MLPAPTAPTWTLLVATLAFVATSPARAQAPAPALEVERALEVTTGVTTALAWSADGKWLASAGPLGDVQVLHAVTGDVAHRLPATTLPVGALRFSPDGERLWIGGDSLRCWGFGEVPSRVFVLREPTAWNLSPDGARVAFARGNDVVVLSTTSFATVRELPNAAAKADVLMFSSDGGRLAVVGRRGGSVIDLATDEVVEFVPARPGPAWLEPRMLTALDPASRLHRLPDELAVLDFVPADVAVDPAADLAVAWRPGRMVVLARGAAPANVERSGPAVVAANGAEWACAGPAGLEVRRGTAVVRTLPLRHVAAPMRAAFTGDGRFLGVEPARGHAQSNGPLVVVDVATGAMLELPPGLLRGRLAAGAVGAELVTWEAPTWVDDRELPGRIAWWSIPSLLAGRTEPVREARFAPAHPGTLHSSPRFAVGGRFFGIDREVRDAATPATVLWSVARSSNTIQPAADGETAFVMNGFGAPLSPHMNVERVARDGTRLARRIVEGGSWSVLSQDGTRLLVGGPARLHVLDAATLARRAVLEVVTRPWGPGDSPGGSMNTRGAWVDDRRVLWADRDGEHVLLDVDAGGAELGRLSLAGARELAIVPDGTRAAVLLADRIVLVRIAR